jgi:hypothetical protein
MDTVTLLNNLFEESKDKFNSDNPIYNISLKVFINMDYYILKDDLNYLNNNDFNVDSLQLYNMEFKYKSKFDKLIDICNRYSTINKYDKYLILYYYKIFYFNKFLSKYSGIANESIYIKNKLDTIVGYIKIYNLRTYFTNNNDWIII